MRKSTGWDVRIFLPMPEQVVRTYVVGISIGIESCTTACLTMDTSIKSSNRPCLPIHLPNSTGFWGRLKGCDRASRDIIRAGSYLALWGEAVADFAQMWLSNLSATSCSDACPLFNNASACENGSVRCNHDRVGAAQRRSTFRLRAE